MPPDTPEYKQLRQERLKPKPATFGEEDILQLSRVRPHYFLPETLYAEEEEDWWDQLPPHDRIWGALEANWRWNVRPAPNALSPYVGNEPQMAEQFSPLRIGTIVRYPNSIWTALSNEQRISLYKIIKSQSDKTIDWYLLLTRYNVDPDEILRLGTSIEIEITIEKLINQWEEDLIQAGRDSPFNISWREFRFRVPDPRVSDILPPMTYASSIQLIYPKALEILKDAPGWEMVQYWLQDSALVALSELFEGNPQLPPLGRPDFYDWLEPELRDQWIRFWRERVPIALETSSRFLGRVFHVPGIPGNEKFNAIQEANALVESAKAWAEIKEQETRDLLPGEMQSLHQDWEEFGQQFSLEE